MIPDLILHTHEDAGNGIKAGYLLKAVQKRKRKYRKNRQKSRQIAMSIILPGNPGAKYLGFFSSHSLKTREKYVSFPQFVLLSSYIS